MAPAVVNTLGDAPDDWDQWTYAEQGLLTSLGVERRRTAYRGGPLKYKAQTLSRCQDGNTVSAPTGPIER